MIIQLDLSELEELQRKVGALDVKKTINKSIRKSIILLERTAKIETPVDTGILRNSYETKFDDLDGRLRNFREYAPYVHFGHKQTPGRFVGAIWKRLKRSFVPWNPWMSRVLKQDSPKVEDIFNNDLEKLLETLK